MLILNLLSSIITSFADKLKGLFTVFVPIYVKQASHLLQVCHHSSTEEFFGADGQAQSLTLLHWVIQSLLQVFTHDRQRFVKQEAFDLLMQPLVDQVKIKTDFGANRSMNSNKSCAFKHNKDNNQIILGWWRVQF